MTDLDKAARAKASYNIAWGLWRILCFSGEPGLSMASRGAEMLRDGIEEALGLLTSRSGDVEVQP